MTNFSRSVEMKWEFGWKNVLLFSFSFLFGSLHILGLEILKKFIKSKPPGRLLVSLNDILQLYNKTLWRWLQTLVSIKQQLNKFHLEYSFSLLCWKLSSTILATGQHSLLSGWLFQLWERLSVYSYFKKKISKLSL